MQDGLKLVKYAHADGEVGRAEDGGLHACAASPMQHAEVGCLCLLVYQSGPGPVALAHSGCLHKL
jgi:hypothetical protein